MTPGHQAADGLDDHEGGDLASGEHVVADRQLAIDEMVGDPLVDAFVAAAQQREPVGVPPARVPSPDRTADHRARAGAAAGAGRRPRRPRTRARARAPCRLRRRTARRRLIGAGRSHRRAGRGRGGRAGRAAAPCPTGSPEEPLDELGEDREDVDAGRGHDPGVTTILPVVPRLPSAARAAAASSIGATREISGSTRRPRRRDGTTRRGPNARPRARAGCRGPSARRRRSSS